MKFKFFILFLTIICCSGIDAVRSFESQLQSSYDNEEVVILGSVIMTGTYDFTFNNNSFLSIESSYRLITDDVTNKNWRTGDILVRRYRLNLQYKQSFLNYRVGLQDIYFGVGRYLRPLQWFDTLDPINKRAATQGINGFVVKTSTTDSQEIVGWMLFGNNPVRPSDLSSTKKETIEIGGRFQRSIFNGELGFATHARQIELNGSRAAEYRIGSHYQSNTSIPIWVEQAYMSAASKTENQQYIMVMVGSQYMFNIDKLGNAVTVLSEIQYDNKPIASNPAKTLTGVLQLSYPLSLKDTISYVGYMSNQDQLEDSFVYSRKYESGEILLQYTNRNYVSMTLYWNH